MKILGGMPYGEVEPPRVTTNAEGWDVMIERECVSSQLIGALGEKRADTRIGGTFFLQGKTCVGFRACAPIMEYRSLGLQANREYTIEGTAFAERVSGTAGNVPDAPRGTQNVSVAINRVGIIARYFTNSKPNMLNVGQRVSPPEDFGTSTYPFTQLADPTYAVPYGWVLDARRPKNLPFTTLYMVEDEYSFYFKLNYNGT